MQLALYQTPEPPKKHDYRKQCQELADACGDGVWKSLRDMEMELNYKRAQTSISARIRNLRAGMLPGWTAESKRDREGKWWYRIRRAN